jgi:hypothetical protein
MDKIIGAADL